MKAIKQTEHIKPILFLVCSGYILSRTNVDSCVLDLSGCQLKNSTISY